MDTNKYGDFVNPKNLDMEPVRKWINNKGKLIYSPTIKMKSELDKHTEMRLLFEQYSQKGKLRRFSPHEVDIMKASLTGLESDDPDIIALALVSGVRLLISGDRILHTDFKRIVRGKIYQNRNHSNLLKQDTCP